MKNLNAKQLTLLILFLGTFSVSGQTTIWFEDFESYGNGTQTGAGTGTSTATWSTNDGDVDVRTSGSSQVLRGQNTDNTTAYWTTNPITITGFTNVSFSLDVGQGGTLDFGQDVFRIQYRIDGGSYVEIENASGDNSPSDPIQSSYSVTGLSGGTLEFRITMYNTGGSELYEIDNILVEGTTSGSSCNTITSSPGSAITDFATLNSNLSGFSSGTITDVNVTLNITHTWDADLNISLTSPGGTTVLLSDDNGGGGNDYTNTIFDDAAGTAITSGSAPFTGTFSPEGNLSDFNGEDPSGTWTLSIYDDAGGDTGTLDSFSIEVCTSTPAAPQIDIADISVNENAGSAVFTVTHSGVDAAGAFSVDYSITAGTASEGVDYTTGSGLYTGTLNFNGTVGDTESITVLITDDFDVEPDETYTIQFTSVTDLSVDITDTAIGTINNDDVAAVIQISDVAVNEDAGNAVFTVTHTGGDTSGSFTVNFQTVNGTATAGSDYTSTTGALNFNGTAGDTDTITVPISSDTIIESDETFTIQFTSSSNGTVNITDTATGTINAQISSDAPLTLYEEFHGNVDYVVTGNTLRTADNGTDPCAVTNTSSGTLIAPIPGTATIRKAYLYWAHSSSTMDADVTFEGQSVTADIAYNAYSASYWSYLSDVTSIVNGVVDPSTNTYDFADLTIDNTTNCGSQGVLGGWALMVFYDDPTLPASSINLYQGFQRLRNASDSFTLDSFYAIAGSGAKATFLSWEGDSTLSGASETLSITNEATNTFTLSGDGGQTGNNAYNSTIYDDTQLPVYNDATTYGLDLDTYGISTYISPGDSQVTANVSVASDAVFFNAVLIRVQSNLITGTVFEDVNYPGGSGRDMATSSGVGVNNATLEIYDSSDVYIKNTTTDSNGDYTFGGIADGDYTVRVVNSTVRSSRGGGVGCTTCYPVQTYRNYNTTGSFVNVTNEVGGADPSAEDAGTATLTGAQTTSAVTIASGGVVGLDFGFNFNTIVNTNEDGQGSLEQFIVNSNNLDETGLDIESNSIFDPAAGDDTSIFMIPTSSDPLSRTADANYTSGYFDISISNGNPLTAITANNTMIDGRTQTAYSGDTNSGNVGSGGTAVGTSSIVLPNYARPEIQVHRNQGDVFDFQANATIRNLGVYASNNAAIQVNSGAVNINANLLGVNAQGANAGNVDYGVENLGGNVTVDGNYIATNTDAGILINGGTSSLIQNNHISNNGDQACDDNIELLSGSGITIQQNLIENAAASGIDASVITGSLTISENSITSSGQDGGNCSGDIENMGIILAGDNSQITNNQIYSNGGAGIVVIDGTGNLISQNSIYGNGTTSAALGIDLDATATVGDGVTLNDSGDADSGPNNLLNFPIISNAYISGTDLIVTGWSRPGTTLEFFLTDISEGTASSGDNQLGLSIDYGEGQTYMGSGVEGSGSDNDSTTSAYSDADGNSDNTNAFRFTIPLSISPSGGDLITATAMLGNSTSEFSPMSTLNIPTVITNRGITYRVNRD